MARADAAAPLTDALVTELGAALGAMLGGGGAVAPAAGDARPGWVITVTIGEPTPGSLTFAIGEDDCASLVRAVTGAESADDNAIADLLRDALGQAVGSVREKPIGTGVLFCVETPARATTLPDGPSRVFTVALGPDLAPAIATWARFDAATEEGAAPAESTAGAKAAGRGRRAAEAGVSTAMPANLDVILDIDLPLSVRFGQADLTLDALSRLGPGSVIDLGRSPEDPVDVLVNGRLVARAEVVVVGGNYGVRILEVVSAADRVRTLSA